MGEHSEKFNKELENIKKNQTELKTTKLKKKYTRRNEQYIRKYRGTDQQTGRQNSENHPI